MLGSFIWPEIIKTPVKIDNTSFKLLAGSNYQVGGYGVKLDSDLVTVASTSMDTGSLTASTLYYVYLVVTSGTYKCVLSLNTVSPAGYLAYKKIGICGTDASAVILGVRDINDATRKWLYNVTSTGTGGWVTNSATGGVEQVGGQWIIDLNIIGYANVAWSGITISTLGILIPSGASGPQNVSCTAKDLNGYQYSIAGFTNAAADSFQVATVSGASAVPTTAYLAFAAKLKLEQKPTFATMNL